ncbi:Sfi1 spindle body domain-containing protein [Plasmodiophora brassicae]|nr:hypothetical protein PBRA_002050 [Plasmodiophora brassicae]
MVVCHPFSDEDAVVRLARWIPPRPRLTPAVFPVHEFRFVPRLSDRLVRASSGLLRFGESEPDVGPIVRDIVSPRIPLTHAPIWTAPPITRTSSVTIIEGLKPAKKASYWEPSDPNLGSRQRPAPHVRSWATLARRQTQDPDIADRDPGPGALRINYDAVLPRVHVTVLPPNELDPPSKAHVSRRVPTPVAVRRQRNEEHMLTVRLRKQQIERCRLERLQKKYERMIMSERTRERVKHRLRTWIAIGTVLRYAQGFSHAVWRNHLGHKFRRVAVIVTRLRAWVYRFRKRRDAGFTYTIDDVVAAHAACARAVRRRRAYTRRRIEIRALTNIIDFFENSSLRATFFRSVHHMLDNATKVQRWWREMKRVRYARLDFIWDRIQDAIRTAKRPRRSRRCLLLEHMICSRLTDRVYDQARIAFRDVLRRRRAGISIELTASGFLRREIWFRMQVLHQERAWRSDIMSKVKAARPHKNPRRRRQQAPVRRTIPI